MHCTIPTQPLSPLARRPKVRPTSPPPLAGIDSDDDSLDELADPAGNARPSQSRHFTQPTQIVDRPALSGAALSHTTSSPQSAASHAVEVPASSPFQQHSRLGSAIAPRGTAFRPPAPRAASSFRPKQVLGKHGSSTPELIDLSSEASSEIEAVVVVDSSEDERPPRGEIYPSCFQRREPLESASPSSAGPSSPVATAAPDSIVAKGSVTEKRLTRLTYVGATSLAKLVPNRINVDYQRALIACNFDKEEAAVMLRNNQASKKPRRDGAKSAGDIRSFIRSFEHKPAAAKRAPSSPQQSSDDENPIIVATPAPKPKGRLQRGLKPRNSPIVASPSAPKPEPDVPIQILDSDDEEFLAGSHGDAQVDVREEKATRILGYLNKCTPEGLLAITGNSKYKRDFVEMIISRRPFQSLTAVERLTLSKAVRKGRSGSKATAANSELANVGEQIIDEISAYIKALDAIDGVVAKCEAEGSRMRRITDGWSMDSKGKLNGGLMTPSSADGHPASKLPIPKEPEYMRGHCSMKPYQLYGLNWLHQLYQHDFGCILADDMGLGKTCQVISLIAHIIESYDEASSSEPRPWPNLIVVPPSTFANWQGEFKKFAPGIKVTPYHGRPIDRDDLGEEIREDPAEHHVVLTTYTQLGREEDILAMSRMRPNAAIFDEGHKVKNAKTNVFKNLSRITAKWRLLLTGTPIQNNIMEMINLLSFIQPDLFQTKVEMLKDVFDQKVTLHEVSNGALLFSDRILRARSILEPFILQRTKEQVLSALPPKTSRVIYCEMDDAQRKIYDGYKSQFRKCKASAPLAKSASGENTKDKNNVWIQLRKSAIHSQLFRRFYTDAKVKEMAEIMMDCIPQDRLQQPQLRHLIAELEASSDFQLHLWCRDEKCISRFDVEPDSWTRSGKVQALLELLREFRRNGDRALVFTRFASVIEILSESLKSDGIPHLSLQGSTKVEDRQDLIDLFNEAPATGDGELTAFLLTTGAGGTGINLAAANKVVIFDLSDNPQDDAQAESRAHRLGQTRPVEVIRLITKDSVEELIHRACQKKLELAEQVTGMSGEQVAREVEEEVRKQILDGE